MPAQAAESTREALRLRLEEPPPLQGEPAGPDLLYSPREVRTFYQRRFYQPAWSDPQGPLAHTDVLFQALRQAEAEGLIAADYHLGQIETLQTKAMGPAFPADADTFDQEDRLRLELLLTDAFLTYGRHLFAGRVDPNLRLLDRPVAEQEVDFPALLEGALKSDSLSETLQGLLPGTTSYGALREALSRYQGIARQGGWPTVPNGTTLAYGTTDERVPILRKRLRASEDLAGSDASPEGPFDAPLEEAVRLFQRRHGLKDDGVVGLSTYRALNVPVEDRIRQIEVNLERRRWLPRRFADRFVVVNTAGFELFVVENGGVVIRMRAVVGKPYLATPSFSSLMTYLVVNPSWHVPKDIAAADILPRLRKDPGYLEREGFKVYQGWGSAESEVDPRTVSWASINGGKVPYHFRQLPGPTNALGRVKFMFPNRFHVYIHDTPARGLFERPVREFSHGCIRIERPLDLAEYVLRGDPAWTRDTLLAEMEKGAEQTVILPKPIPVMILYMTAWVEPDGTLQFREDTYRLDEQVLLGLRSPLSRVE